MLKPKAVLHGKEVRIIFVKNNSRSPTKEQRFRGILQSEVHLLCEKALDLGGAYFKDMSKGRTDWARKNAQKLISLFRDAYPGKFQEGLRYFE